MTQALFSRIEVEVGGAPHSVEITLFETPTMNWGITGRTAQDLFLGDKVEVEVCTALQNRSAASA